MTTFTCQCAYCGQSFTASDDTAAHEKTFHIEFPDWYVDLCSPACRTAALEDGLTTPDGEHAVLRCFCDARVRAIAPEWLDGPPREVDMRDPRYAALSRLQ